MGKIDNFQRYQEASNKKMKRAERERESKASWVYPKSPQFAMWNVSIAPANTCCAASGVL